jgi:hypothetical protein
VYKFNLLKSSSITSSVIPSLLPVKIETDEFIIIGSPVITPKTFLNVTVISVSTGYLDVTVYNTPIEPG